MKITTFDRRLVVSLMLAASTTMASANLVGCADENDPKTWVKRLDDPAQRAPAIKRLSQFFEDGFTKAQKNREAPELKQLLDTIVEPLTKTYTAGGLDDKTRRDLMKSLADMRDPRTAPALAKAFNDYEPGKNDDDVKFASQAVTGLAQSGQALDQGLTDALWGAFAHFQVSKAKSINLVTDLHDAVLAAKNPSYGPKAVERLARPVDPKSVDQVRDEIQFWQLTSIQILRDLKFVPGVKPLVKVLLTPEKRDLFANVESALMHMPNESEPLLVALLRGTDEDMKKAAMVAYPNKEYVTIAADALAWIGRPAGRDAVLGALAEADSDTNRQALANVLVKFPPDPRLQPAFRGAYDKLPTTDEGMRLRGLLIQSASQFYDASLTDWLAKEFQGAKGDFDTVVQVPALEASIKLMTEAHQKTVGEMAAKLEGEMSKHGNQGELAQAKILKQMYEGASQTLAKCKEDTACYLKVLDDPIPTGTPGANAKAIKAAWMVAVHSNNKDQARQQLVAKVDKVKNPGARLAVAEAIDHLAPKGDTASAAVLEKVVDGDKSSGDKLLLSADDALVKVALRLRGRAH